MVISFLTILVGCVIYGAVHSILASYSAKAWAARTLGKAGKRYYRLFFNLMAGLTTLLIFYLAWRLPDAPLYTIPFPWLIVTLGIQGLGLAGLAVGLYQTGIENFLGLDVFLHRKKKTRIQARLVTGGLYRWVRHPLYTCGLMVLWFSPVMTWNLLALAIGLTGYILVGINFEERKLLREYGQAYAIYRRRTPRLIPFSKDKSR